MKKLVICLLVLTLLVPLLPSCSAQKEVYRIELIVKGTQTEFWQSVYDGAKAATGNHVELSFLGPAVEKDYRDQLDILADAIHRKPDAIILAAGDYYLMAEPMEQLVEAGIPIIMVDSGVDSTQWVSFVATDNHQLGETLAQELKQRLPGGGTIGVISFVQSSYTAVERERGFQAAMQDSNQYRLLETLYCDSNIDRAQMLTQQLLAEYPDLDGIVGLNAQSACGAARALDNLGLDEVFMAGIDCTVEQADFIERGIMDVAVLQNPYAMGYYSVKAAIDHLSGKQVEKLIYTDIHIVDRYNLFDDKVQQLIFPFG